MALGISPLSDQGSLSETQIAIERARISSPQIPPAVWDAMQELAKQVSTVRHEQANHASVVSMLTQRLYGFEGRGGDIREIQEDVREVRHSMQSLIRLNWTLIGLGTTILGGVIAAIITRIH